ncbi:hypothetical protein BH23ACI1_BH23ACI1_25780 [soil metagenome]
MTATRTAATETLSQAYDRSRDVFGVVASETQDLYESARAWVPKHYGTVAVLSSAAAGVGLVGYLAGRRSRPAPARAPQRAQAALPALPELDIAPFFKFLKLWMLYRVATRD